MSLDNTIKWCYVPGKHNSAPLNLSALSKDKSLWWMGQLELNLKLSTFEYKRKDLRGFFFTKNLKCGSVLLYPTPFTSSSRWIHWWLHTNECRALQIWINNQKSRPKRILFYFCFKIMHIKPQKLLLGNEQKSRNSEFNQFSPHFTFG